jgi:hypothetical protein
MISAAFGQGFGQEPDRVGETMLGQPGEAEDQRRWPRPGNPQPPNPLHGDARPGGDLHRSQRSGG